MKKDFMMGLLILVNFHLHIESLTSEYPTTILS